MIKDSNNMNGDANVIIDTNTIMNSHESRMTSYEARRNSKLFGNESKSNGSGSVIININTNSLTGQDSKMKGDASNIIININTNTLNGAESRSKSNGNVIINVNTNSPIQESKSSGDSIKLNGLEPQATKPESKPSVIDAKFNSEGDANAIMAYKLSNREAAMVRSASNPYPKYQPQLEVVKPEMREMLLRSGVPEDQQKAHIVRVRERAWDIHPFPCIGLFYFIDLSITSLPAYYEALARVKTGQKMLDMACCFGQVLRKMEYDGAPSANLYGTDLHSDFIRLGYDLFLDKHRFDATFLTADIFDDNSDLNQIDGQMDVIHASAFFHLFTREQQLKVAKRIVSLLKPQKGSLFFGSHTGDVNGGDFANPGGFKVFRHNPATWTELWDEVGRETGTRWQTDSELTETLLEGPLKLESESAGMRYHRFTVRRL